MEDWCRDGLQFVPDCLYPCPWVTLPTLILGSTMCLALARGTTADVIQADLNSAFTFGMSPLAALGTLICEQAQASPLENEKRARLSLTLIALVSSQPTT